VVSFEQRADKPVSPDMIAALDVPEEVARFDLLKFCVKNLNYTVLTPPGAGRGDLMLIPAELAAVRGSKMDPSGTEWVPRPAASTAAQGL
jgi:hypothetical protein